MPANMKAIFRISQKYEIPVIEDAAEALGSSIAGQRCGTFGMFSVLSFNGNKIITTSGGGALLSDRHDLIEKARFLATQARDKAPHYQHSELGFNYRMSNISAGIGRGQMIVLDDRISARRQNHDYYFKALGQTWFKATSFNGQEKSSLLTWSSMAQPKSPTGIYFLKEPAEYYSNRWLTTVLVNPSETGGITKDDIRQTLEKENIETRPLWKPMHLQPLYKDFPYYGKGISDLLFTYGLCLPSGSNLSFSDRKKVSDAIMKLVKTKQVLT
jgi:dTDP-4-amino-4,6-dideoxygalactose transaminase